MDLTTVAQLLGIVAVLAALPGAFIAVRGWRLKNRHWLYIPAPIVHSQEAAKPDFWVFPPTEIANGVHAVVIAGAVVNAGPSDAFSVRIYADPEIGWEEGIEPLEAAIDVAAAHPRTDEGHDAVARMFLEAYKNRRSLIPVLRVGCRQQFVVIAKFERGDPYLEEILSAEGAGEQVTCHWEHENSQAHQVHAMSRTILGRRLEFEPGDLCAPFESERSLQRWAEERPA